MVHVWNHKILLDPFLDIFSINCKCRVKSTHSVESMVDLDLPA